MKFAAYMAFLFITFFHILWVPFFYHCMYGCMVCLLLFNFVNQLFLLLGLCILTVMFMFSDGYVMFYSVYYVSLCCSVYCFVCKCIIYYIHRVSTQLQLLNISYYIIIYVSAKIHIRYLRKKEYFMLQQESGFLVYCKMFVFQKAS
jgi:hypothetical protein